MNRMSYKSYCDKMNEKGKKPMSEEAFKAMSAAEHEETMKALSISPDPAEEQGDPVDAVAGDEGTHAGPPPSIIKAKQAAAELTKSLDAAEQIADIFDPAKSLQKSLEAKVAANTATREDRVQLAKLILGDEPATTTSLRKSLADHVRENASPSATELIDASEALDTLVKSIDASLSGFRDSIEHDAATNREMNKAQHAVVQNVGRALVTVVDAVEAISKSVNGLNSRIAQVESTPLPPRAVNPAAPFAKSAIGTSGAPKDQRILKSKIDDALRVISEKAVESGNQERMDKALSSTALWETTGTLDKFAQIEIKKLNS